MSGATGMVAAGHPKTAEVGAEVLRAGGNAVDAAIAAVLASWVCEPLLTGPGAGGYMLVAGAGEEPTLLDFFVAAPGHGSDVDHAPLIPVEVSFGDAEQTFYCGAASCGVPGSPAGIAAASDRWGTLPLADLAAPAARLAREGVPLNGPQAYVFEILDGILCSTPSAEAEFTSGGRSMRPGEPFSSPELAETIERLGRDGSAPFYSGDIGAAIVEDVQRLGGLLDQADLDAYEVIARAPASATYRGRTILTNPPPSAGGILLVLAFSRLQEICPVGAPSNAQLLEVVDEVQSLRTPQFTAGLIDPDFLRRFLAANLGSTTHVSVIDGDGRACTVTCSNGEGSALVVPGTGIHVNNMMGEEDLNPLGFFRAAPGQRMPSMMAPTAVMGPGGEVELAIGSAGSNRIRSAILQVIVNLLDHSVDVRSAVNAPRFHSEGGSLFTEPGIDLGGVELGDRDLVEFRAENLFFGGTQAVTRSPLDGSLDGAGDPRRGGAAVGA
ncbi:MAG: gamma-glutamyltransferase [Actinobacteria bacterium]|uniref:Unannotated protein n=1 Tax=freshwater metagenome TaxID=449393 RepID=A0A6J5Z1I3_9ZZZZ|nr:gamma-glutamyltransferase [Actinomycetota bacterium]